MLKKARKVGDPRGGRCLDGKPDDVSELSPLIQYVIRIPDVFGDWVSRSSHGFFGCYCIFLNMHRLGSIPGDSGRFW